MKFFYALIIILVACRPSNQIGELVGAINDRPLEDTTWVLVELNGKEIYGSEYPRPISVIFHKSENRVSGFAGCNSFTGTYQHDGATISAILASTRMFCEGKMETETALLQVLNTPHKLERKDGHLLLKDKSKVVARFQAQIDTSK